MSTGAHENVTARSLNELRRAHATDATLQSLLVVLNAKLDLCARLPVFEYEAASEGFEDAVNAFAEFGRTERAGVEQLLCVLRRHLDRAVPQSEGKAS